MSALDSRLDDLCDGVLQSDDGCTFNIHKIVLARKCDYFLGMFCGINKDRSEFRVPGVSGRCLLEILNYIYTGEVSVTGQNLADLMEASDYLLLSDLCLLIKRRFKEHVTTSNCLRVFNIAYHINDENITQTSFRFIETRFEEAMHAQVNDLAELPLEVLERILGSRSLNVCNETSVWLSIVEWTYTDITKRSEWVPQLLMSLAMKELDEDLAEEILKHEIVSENISMSGLNELKDSPDFTSHLDALLHFLENQPSRCFTRPLGHRLPPRLHVIASLNGDSDINLDAPSYELHITYDENFDLWRRVGDCENFRPKFLTAVGHSVYLFDHEGECLQFDLVAQSWIHMPSIRNVYRYVCVVEFGECIYLMGSLATDSLALHVEIYDVASRSWSDGATVSNIFSAVAAVANGKIYVVGITKNNGVYGMTSHVFDTTTRVWTPLPTPNIRRVTFTLVAHRGKVYLIGGYDVRGGFGPANTEVFHPETNRWEELPHLENTYAWITASVLNDQIYLYDGWTEESTPSILHWNEAEVRWEQLEATPFLRNMKDRLFSSVTDVEAVRRIMKENRLQSRHLVESLCK